MSQPNEPESRGDREESGLCRRRGGRLHQESICSNLGVVLDLAPGGARIFARSRPADQFTLRLEDHVGRIEIRAEVAWSRRRGLFKHELGIRFLGVPPEAASRITQMSMANRHQRFIHRDKAA